MAKFLLSNIPGQLCSLRCAPHLSDWLAGKGSGLCRCGGRVWSDGQRRGKAGRGLERVEDKGERGGAGVEEEFGVDGQEREWGRKAKVENCR